MVKRWELTEDEKKRDSIGVRIKQRRFVLRISTPALAKSMGVSRQTVISDEAGGDMPVSRLYDYAKALGCTVHELIPKPRRGKNT